jgi:hypothetical protein
VDGWTGGGGKNRRMSVLPKCGKAEMRHFGKGRATEFPLVCSAEAEPLLVPRTGRAAEVREVCISNVIYQKVYLIRLIYISGILSN